MRILVFLVVLAITVGAAAQSPTPTPPDRPTLNRPGSPSPSPSPTPPGTQPPAPSPSPTPAAEAGQPDSPVKYPKPSYAELVRRFDYDSKTGLDIREINYQKRGNIMLIELNYAGSGGDRVPAYLVLPHGGDDHPAIIWGHWLKKGSPLANKNEFLEEALVLARAGVVSLLIDAPQARHDFVEEKGTLDYAKQQSEASEHQLIDLRRAVDLLMVRKDVDRRRIAYVGHSWDAHVGGILAGVEIRICCYVLMGSSYSDEEDVFASPDDATRKELGDDAVREYFHEYAFDDPVYFISHTDTKSIFLQFGMYDYIKRDRAQQYLSMFTSKDKQMQFYESGHEFNSAARLDRVRWLQKHLGFKRVDEKELEAIPQLK
jgi:hypothetical protein